MHTETEQKLAIEQLENNVKTLEPETNAAFDQEIAHWNQRIHDTKHYVNVIKQDIGNSTIAAYFVDNKPIGIIAINESVSRPSVYVRTLVTHPLSESAGSLLMEFAVKISTRYKDTHGKVSLAPSSPHSCTIYQHFGFLNADNPSDNKMYLDVTKSDKWMKDDLGNWRLKSNINKRYVATLENIRDTAIEISRSRIDSQSTPATHVTSVAHKRESCATKSNIVPQHRNFMPKHDEEHSTKKIEQDTVTNQNFVTMALTILDDLAQTTLPSDVRRSADDLISMLNHEIAVVSSKNNPNGPYSASEHILKNQLDIETKLSELSSSNQDQSAFSRLLQKIIAFFRKIFGLKPEPKKLSLTEHLPRLAQFFRCPREHAQSASEQSDAAPDRLSPVSTH